MSTVVFALVFVALLVYLVHGWGWTGIRALATHPPLGPYQPRWWWEDGLLRFLRAGWKALLVIQTLFLSALIAADLRDVTGKNFSSRWYGAMGQVTSAVLVFILLGLVGGAALQVWRISREPEWPFGERSMWRCFAPTLPLGCLLVIGWTAILT